MKMTLKRRTIGPRQDMVFWLGNNHMLY